MKWFSCTQKTASMEIACTVSSELLGSWFFSLFFVSGPCTRLSWPSRQLLSARKSTLSYRIVTKQNLFTKIKISLTCNYQTVHSDEKLQQHLPLFSTRVNNIAVLWSLKQWIISNQKQGNHRYQTSPAMCNAATPFAADRPVPGNFQNTICTCWAYWVIPSDV